MTDSGDSRIAGFCGEWDEGCSPGQADAVIAERFEVKVGEKDEAQAKPEWCLGAAAFLALSPGAARAGRNTGPGLESERIKAPIQGLEQPKAVLLTAGVRVFSSSVLELDVFGFFYY